MRIIEPGTEYTPPTWRVRCGDCKSLLEYKKDDIYAGCHGVWIRCAECRTPIPHASGVRVDPGGAGSG